MVVMGAEIGLVAPYPELEHLAREVCKELGENVNIVQGDLSVGLQVAQKMQSEGVEVIVSRGGTALLISEALDIPVVPIQVTGFDIIRTLHFARQFGDKIGVVGFKEVIYGTDALQDILGVPLTLMYIEREEDAEDIIRTAVQSGVGVIIGDAISVRIAERYGAKGVLVESGKEAIVKAIDEAKHVASVRKRERERAEEFKAILDFSYEGIVSIDEEGIIRVFNPVAERFLRVKASYALGKRIVDVLPDIGPDLVRALRKPELDRIRNIAGTVVVSNRVPITLGENVVGAVITFQDARRIQQTEKEVRRELYLKGHVAKHTFADLITESSSMKRMIAQATRFAATDSTVLITGETGTGKELVAQGIHNASSRRKGPFVAVNCAALPASILESELFGYEEGAFTGSRKRGKPGLFELAHGGSIFLDEIGDMPLSMQARLLRVLEQREVMRLGGEQMIPVDIRVIAATHRDLKRLVKEDAFRSDLYYRLDVLNVSILSLRERREDIAPLALHFVESFCKSAGVAPKRLAPDALEILLDYQWPGNVRELKNVCERLAIGVENDEIGADDVYVIIGGSDDGESMPEDRDEDLITVPIRGGMRRIEEEIMREVLRKVDGDRTEAARLLGVSRTTLWRRLGGSP
jgi:propionate catabolism regulator PrpR